MGLNILELTHNWPAETFIQRHIRALQDANLSVQVVARHATEAIRASASLGVEDDVIHARVMPNFNHLNWTGKLSSLRHITVNSLFSKSIPALSEKMLLGFFERLHPHLIHFHTASLASSMAWIPNALGVPYTLSLRGSDVQVIPYQSPAQKEATISAIKGAEKVHSVCYAIGRTAAQLLDEELNFSVIYTTLPVLPDLPDREDMKVDGQFHFISSGRLVWHKGFNNLMIAFRSLRDTTMNAKLTIFGTGPDLEQLLYLRKALRLEADVNFPGKSTYGQIQEAFKIAHAYVQSSLAEGLSNSLAEAMANGLPAFATDVGGTREVIEDGVTGYLLPPFAPHEWAAILLRIKDVPVIKQIRQAAYEESKHRFCDKSHASAFSLFYSEALRDFKGKGEDEHVVDIYGRQK
jgi:glycosyltransferase involved in cell wall biosynthesis